MERDRLMDLVEGSLRRLHLMDLRASSQEVGLKLSAEGLGVEEERDLLSQKVQLDREIQAILAHFGTVILP